MDALRQSLKDGGGTRRSASRSSARSAKKPTRAHARHKKAG